jgi:hypothetical protein
LALVGLAKNTGKTVTLTALLRELASAGRPVGVTSVGRDGEEHDVIDARIAKPRLRLTPGSWVATTEALLRASGVEHELLERTGLRTPLGEVVIARTSGSGAIEVAGPSTAAGVRAVADTMLAHGAEQVVIDGAIDRRAASSPDVADGLVVSTGAVLSADLDEVVARTRDALAVMRLPRAAAPPAYATGADPARSVLFDEGGRVHELAPRFVLTAGQGDLETLLASAPDARTLLVAGALPEQFALEVSRALRRAGRTLTVIAADSTKVFLAEHPPEWYERQGLRIEVLTPVHVSALTVNPVAPRSHELDSAQLRARLRAELTDVPMFDVLAADYPGNEAVRELALGRGGA